MEQINHFIEKEIGKNDPNLLTLSAISVQAEKLQSKGVQRRDINIEAERAGVYMVWPGGRKLIKFYENGSF